MARNRFLGEMKSDLISFQRLLKKYFEENLPNHSEIGKVISQLSTVKNGILVYEDVRLEFKNLNLGKTVRPNFDEEQCKNALLELIFTRMKCFPDDSHPHKDPIHEYQLQLVLKVSNLETLLAKCSWHFEKHPDKKPDGSPENEPEFLHPLYHLHFGGYEMTDEDKGLEFGNVLLVEAPRIMHPPMDIVLAVDFVIKNFYSCHSCQPLISLVTDPDYIRIVKNARERFWKPFAYGIASNFATNHHFGTIQNVSVNSTYARNLFTYSEQH